ncbi:MAG: lysoplasmalogenase [Firmicutes bacterium]|nr:lysoplasmalogenase [Bacillota bacterium]
MTMNNWILVIFIVLALANLYYEKKGVVKGRYFTKPFLIPLLLVYYLSAVENPQYLIIFALIFGFLGDLFLMIPGNQNFFISGLSSFLIGHVFYIIAFFQQGISLWLILPYLIYLIYLNKSFFSFVSEMKIPVLIYTTVIMLMSLSALSRITTTSGWAFLLPFAGSVFFIISDHILAYSKFKTVVKHEGIYVMSTYILAQFLIVWGLTI